MVKIILSAVVLLSVAQLYAGTANHLVKGAWPYPYAPAQSIHGSSLKGAWPYPYAPTQSIGGNTLKGAWPYPYAPLA